MKYRAICGDCGATSPVAYPTEKYALHMVLTIHRCGDVCRACGFRRPGNRRGLCRPCHRDPEVRMDFPRLDNKRPASDTVEDVIEFLETGLGIEVVADRLGLKEDSIRTNLVRAGRYDLYLSLIENSPSSERRKAALRREVA